MLAACALSIEPSEPLFSLAARFSRVMGFPMPALFRSAATGDWSALRDFPVAAAALERLMDTRFTDYAKLISDHSAALYFGATVPEPFRSQETNASFAKVGNLLRMSAATTWGHLRFCEYCAKTEYRAHRYSWWHRDHQLPLTSICLVHECELCSVHITEMGQNFPHELPTLKIHLPGSKAAKLALRIARFDQFLASGYRSIQLQQAFDWAKEILAEESKDIFDQHVAACARIWKLLGISGVTAAVDDWDRLSRSVHTLLRDGFQYSDPVVVVLLVVAMNDQLDF